MQLSYQVVNQHIIILRLWLDHLDKEEQHIQAEAADSMAEAVMEESLQAVQGTLEILS